MGQGHQSGLSYRSPRRRWQNGARSQDGRARCAPSACLLHPKDAKKSGPNWRWAKKPTRSPKPANCFPPCQLADGSVPLMLCTSTASVFQLLRSKQAYPLFVIKGNEPTLQVDLATYFADPHAQFQQAETIDRQRGRVERRTIQVSSEMCSYLHTCWPGVTHVAQLRRTRTEKEQTTVARRLSHRHPATWLRWAAIPLGTEPRALGDRKQLTLRARCDVCRRSLSHPRLPTLLSFWLLVATSPLPSFTAQALLTLPLRVARSLLILALLLTSCFPGPPPSNNSQTLALVATPL